MWEFALGRVVMQGGPYAGVRKSDKLDKLVNEAARLFSCGDTGKTQWVAKTASRG